jgi:hypothetical protein
LCATGCIWLRYRVCAELRRVFGDDNFLMRSISHDRGSVLKLGLRCEIRDGASLVGRGSEVRRVPLVGRGEAGCPGGAWLGRPVFLSGFLGSNLFG